MRGKKVRMNAYSLKNTVKKYLPAPVFTAIQKGRNVGIRLRCAMVPRKPYHPGKYPFGVNLAGFIQAEMGLGQSCRCVATALEAGGIPFSAIDYQFGACSRMEDPTWQDKMNGIRYAVNLTVINADQLFFAVPRLGREYWDGRYQIAHYVWELPEYPAEWVKISEIFQEIWTPSNFCTKAIAAAVNRPVYTIPYVIKPEIKEQRSRAYFGFPEEEFLFLCMFDVNSVIQRKNPKAAIEAFLKAFADNTPGVGLVVKVNDAKGTPEAQEYLQNLICAHRNIYLLDSVLSRNDVNALIQVCDCFVSMHRSEGFGLAMAEAMYFERPVIATNWSANTDFMNSGNSCPVKYRLVEVDQDYVVYKKGQIWAEPDVDDCARYMKRLFEDPAYYEAVAKAGRSTILEKYSAESASKAIQERLKEIAAENLTFVKTE